MKWSRFIFSILQALLTFICISFLAFTFYTELESPFNIVLTTGVLILAIYASYFVFTIMMRRGIMSTMTGDNATYDLDYLEPVPGEGYHKLTAEELNTSFSTNQLNLGSYKISIWGDWESRQLDSYHKLTSIDFKSEENILTLTFEDYYLLKIQQPTIILMANSFLKILNAKEVIWQYPYHTDDPTIYRFINTGKEIIFKSNTNWKPNKYDFGKGMDAIYLQGKNNSENVYKHIH